MRETELAPALSRMETSQPQGLCRAKGVLLCPGHRASLREPGKRGENICYQKTLTPSDAKSIQQKLNTVFSAQSKLLA